MIRIELKDLKPEVVYEDIATDMLPDRLKPYVIDRTRKLTRIKHEIEQGVVTQVWERVQALSPKHVNLHRFTLRFPESEL